MSIGIWQIVLILAIVFTVLPSFLEIENNVNTRFGIIKTKRSFGIWNKMALS